MKKPIFQNRSRAGLSAIEVIVLILMVLIIAALFMPAAQRSRGEARRVGCKNNLKQLGLALHNYHDIHEVFPFGQINNIRTSNSFPSNTTWALYLYPFLEQDRLHEQFAGLYDKKKSIDFPVKDTVVSVLACPSDPHGGKVGHAGFQGNYAGCAGSNLFGSKGEGTDLDGMFYVRSSLSIDNVTDGLSQTILIGEVIQTPVANFDAEKDLTGAYFFGWDMESCFSTLKPPNTKIPDSRYGEFSSNFAWIEHTDDETLPTVTYSRSHHKKGSQFTFGDGSVRFIANEIDPEIYRALGTRSGNEKVAGKF